MFDVVLSENEIKGDYWPEAPLEIRFEFDGKEDKFQTGFLPVWNVHTIRAGQSAFPAPTPDRINYEYRFQFPDFDESGYLVDLDNPELISMRREKDALIAVSPKKEGSHGISCKFYSIYLPRQSSSLSLLHLTGRRMAF